MKQLTAFLMCIFSLLSCQKEDQVLEQPKPQLQIGSTSLMLEGSSNSIDSFTIQYAGKWRVSTIPAGLSWLEVEPASGTGDTKVYVKVKETNNSGESKTAMLVVTPDEDASRATTISVSQGQYQFTPWQNLYGGTENDGFSAVLPTDDGGYIAVGSTMSNNGDVSSGKGKTDAWIVKVDAEGRKIWQKAYGGTENDNANAITAAEDGGYIIVGQTSSSDGDVTHSLGQGDVWVLKIDANGTLLWQKSYGGSSYEQAFAVTSTSDGSFLIAAVSSSLDGDVTGLHMAPGNSGQGDAWLIKIDATGQKVWAKVYGGTNSEMAIAITKTADGGFVAVGYTDAYQTDGDVTPARGSLDVWVFKVNGNGDLQWQKSFGSASVDFATSIVTTSDNGYVVTGFASSSDGDVTGHHGSRDAWVIKLDGNGALVWHKSIGGTDDDVANAICSDGVNGYYVAGNTSSVDGDVSEQKGKGDAWIIKLSNAGELEWQKTYGGSNTDAANGIAKTEKGSLIVAGTSMSTSGEFAGQHGKEDAWLFRVKY